MKTLTNAETDLLVRAWRSVSDTNKKTPMDYAARLYHTFMRFVFIKGMRLIGDDVCREEERILSKDLALMYIGALRQVLDPKGEETEADVVAMMIMATSEERRAAIQYMKKQGVSF